MAMLLRFLTFLKLYIRFNELGWFSFVKELLDFKLRESIQYRRPFRFS